jgi:UPF0716 protein FxsA
MVGLLRLLLLLWPVAEILVVIAVAQWIGVGWTVLALLASALAGGLVIRVLGAAGLAELRGVLERREPPAGALLRGACVLLAGMLLIVPGFIGDAVALLLLIPPLRSALVRALWRGVGRARRGGGPTVLEGEYRDVTIDVEARRIDHHDEPRAP